MYSTGLDDREPLKMADDVVLYQAGSVAAVAAMGALFAARRTGEAQHVDVSIFETQAGSIDRRMSTLIAYQYTGGTSGRRPMENTGGYPQGVFPCKDGYVEITGGGIYFPRSIRMLGEPDFLKEERWHAPDAQHDPDLKAEFEAFFYPWVLSRTKREVWAAAQGARVLSAPINTMEDLHADPVFAQRGAFAEAEHPAAGRLRYPGRPFAMERTPMVDSPARSPAGPAHAGGARGAWLQRGGRGGAGGQRRCVRRAARSRAPAPCRWRASACST